MTSAISPSEFDRSEYLAHVAIIEAGGPGVIRLDRRDVSTRAKLLAYRRAVVQAAASKRRPPKLSRPRHPSAIAVEFTRWLLAWSRMVDREILRALKAEGIVRIDEDAPVVDLSRTDVTRLVAALRRRVAKLSSPGALKGKLEQLANRTERFAKQEWASQLERTLGIPVSADPETAALVDRFTRENVKRIVSLSEEKVDRVERVLRDAGVGARVETVTDDIQEQLGVTESHAALIARTETATLNARLTQAQHQTAGIEQFTVSTSRDERVRPSHAVLDGATYAYNSPPIVDGERWLPGMGFQCRCVAIAVLPGIDAPDE